MTQGKGIPLRLYPLPFVMGQCLPVLPQRTCFPVPPSQHCGSLQCDRFLVPGSEPFRVRFLLLSIGKFPIDPCPLKTLQPSHRSPANQCVIMCAKRLKLSCFWCRFWEFSADKGVCPTYMAIWLGSEIAANPHYTWISIFGKIFKKNEGFFFVR